LGLHRISVLVKTECRELH